MQLVSQQFAAAPRCFDPLLKCHAVKFSDSLNLAQDEFSDLDIYETTKFADPWGMDIKEIRLANLQRLIDEKAQGHQGHFAQVVGTNAGYISQMKSRKTKAGMGESFARRLEVLFSLPHGWMDVLQHDETAAAAAAPATSAMPPEVRVIYDAALKAYLSGSLSQQTAESAANLLRSLSGNAGHATPPAGYQPPQPDADPVDALTGKIGKTTHKPSNT